MIIDLEKTSEIEKKLVDKLTTQLMIEENKLNDVLEYLTKNKDNTHCILEKKIIIDLEYPFYNTNLSNKGSITIGSTINDIRVKRDFYENPTKIDILNGLNDYLFKLNQKSFDNNNFKYKKV